MKNIRSMRIDITTRMDRHSKFSATRNKESPEEVSSTLELPEDVSTTTTTMAMENGRLGPLFGLRRSVEPNVFYSGMKYR